MKPDTANLNTALKRTVAPARVVWLGEAIWRANGGGRLDR